jgi:hypothetical protein
MPRYCARFGFVFKAHEWVHTHCMCPFMQRRKRIQRQARWWHLFLPRSLMFCVSIGWLTTLCNCSVFISTPHTAKISIQGLDNTYYEYIIALDDPVKEKSLDIHITKNYAIQLDFEWLWESDSKTQLFDTSMEDDLPSPLTPWLLCKYRF